MGTPWSGIERRLERLDACVARLEALAGRARADFEADLDLRDIAERNFEIAGQCVIDIALRAVSLAEAPRVTDGHDAVRALGGLGVLSRELADRIAPIARFRNVLAHEYVDVDWALVHAGFGRLSDLREFAAGVRAWLRRLADERARGPEAAGQGAPPAR